MRCSELVPPPAVSFPVAELESCMAKNTLNCFIGIRILIYILYVIIRGSYEYQVNAKT